MNVRMQDLLNMFLRVNDSKLLFILSFFILNFILILLISLAFYYTDQIINSLIVSKKVRT